MKKIILLLLLSYSASYAQSDFVVAGATVQNQSGSVSYTIGQTFHQSFEYNSISITVNEGMQQPYWDDDEVVASFTEDQEDVESILDKFETSPIDFSIYPNPSVNAITLTVPDYQDGGDYLYMIIDTQGRLVTTRRITSSQTGINISHLEDGLFYLSISRQNTPIKSFKLLKFSR